MVDGVNGYYRSKNSYIGIEGFVSRLPAGLYKCDRNYGQSYFNIFNITTDELFIFPDSQSEEILSRIQAFFANAEKYRNFGVIHKLSLVLYGEPGCGKTVMSELVVKDYIASGGVCLYAEDSGYLIGCLKSLRASEPDRPVLVLLEDIDNFSEGDMLDLWDGEEQIDHVCYLSTTNKVDSLSARLKRPGRVDDLIKVDFPSVKHREYYIRRKCQDIPDKHMGKIISATNNFSLAALRNLLVEIYVRGIALETAIAKFAGSATR